MTPGAQVWGSLRKVLRLHVNMLVWARGAISQRQWREDGRSETVVPQHHHCVAARRHYLATRLMPTALRGALVDSTSVSLDWLVSVTGDVDYRFALINVSGRYLAGKQESMISHCLVDVSQWGSFNGRCVIRGIGTNQRFLAQLLELLYKLIKMLSVCVCLSGCQSGWHKS